MEEAASKSKPNTSFFKSLFGQNSTDYDAIAELYVRAGNSFKAGKYWEDAASAFSKAAEACVTGGEPEEGARKYVMAANALKRDNPKGRLNFFSLY